MKYKTVLDNFADLATVVNQIITTSDKPAKTRYEQQAEKMNYRQVKEAKDNIDLIRDIVGKREAKPIKFKDGQIKVDLTTANFIVKVFDKLDSKNQIKFKQLANGKKADFMKLHGVVMKLLKKSNEQEESNVPQIQTGKKFKSIDKLYSVLLRKYEATEAFVDLKKNFPRVGNPKAREVLKKLIDMHSYDTMKSDYEKSPHNYEKRLLGVGKDKSSLKYFFKFPEAVKSANEDVNKMVEFTVKYIQELAPAGKWWKSEPDDLLTYVYWTRGQIPPSDKDGAYKSIVNALQKKAKAPKKDYEKHLAAFESVKSGYIIRPTEGQLTAISKMVEKKWSISKIAKEMSLPVKSIKTIVSKLIHEGKFKNIAIDFENGVSDEKVAKKYKVPLSTIKKLKKDWEKGAKEEVGLDEWKMGDGRPRGASYIENIRFWDLSKDKLEYIKKDSDKAMKANPNNPKNTKGKGNYADQINDADTVLAWRKKKGIKEEIVSEGTWAVPDNVEKIEKLNIWLERPHFIRKDTDVDDIWRDVTPLVGDDDVADDWNGMVTTAGPHTRGDARDPVVWWLKDWGFRVKGYTITHAPQVYVKKGDERPFKLRGEDAVSRAAEMAKLKKKHDAEKEKEQEKIKDIGAAGAKEDVNVEEGIFKKAWAKIKGKGRIKRPHGKLISLAKTDTHLEPSRKKEAKERHEHAKKSPFKLKSEKYPRAIAINSEGFGKRHATMEDIVIACETFGMIEEKELQVKQIDKELGRQGFISYSKNDLNNVFEEREIERILLYLESELEEQTPIEYTKTEIQKALDEKLIVEFLRPDGFKSVGPVLKMSGKTYNVKDRHTGKSYTYKYIEEGNQMNYEKSWTEPGEGFLTFNQLTEIKLDFNPALIKKAIAIANSPKFKGGDYDGALKAIEKLHKGLSNNKKVRAALKSANEDVNNMWREAGEMGNKSLNDGDKAAYQKFFKSALKKFGVSSPAELEDDKKKEFFDYIDKNWKGDHESVSEIRVDGRRKNFREKLKRLGYIKSTDWN